MTDRTAPLMSGFGASETLVAAARPRIEGYLAALWLVSPFMPWVAAAVTVLVYLMTPAGNGVAGMGVAPSPGWLAVGAGVTATVVLWLVAGIPVRAVTTADRAQPRFFNELQERRQQLQDRLRGLPVDAEPVAEARTQLTVASQLLDQSGAGPALRWALAHGYISVLRALHRAEEALFAVESRDNLTGEALQDELSLESSTISDRKRLQEILRAATYRLSPAAGKAFLPPDPGTTQQPVEELSENEAREGLREVRHAINTFRDDARDGLIRARNQLAWTLLAVAGASYLLLSLALIADLPKSYIATASAFYLVGAIIGLFDRLRVEAARTTAIEDFGLFQVRLLTTPIVSGIAAVAGVYLVSMAPTLVSPGAEGATLTPLANVFDLAKNEIGLVYAAIFGLVPSTLTGGLRQQADRLERDLLSSQPAASTGAP